MRQVSAARRRSPVRSGRFITRVSWRLPRTAQTEADLHHDAATGRRMAGADRRGHQERHPAAGSMTARIGYVMAITEFERRGG